MMFGKLLKIVTLPLDATNVLADLMTGGDGSKDSRRDVPLLGDLEHARDELVDDFEDE